MTPRLAQLCHNCTLESSEALTQAMSAAIDLKTIRAAHDLIRPQIHRTPVLTSESLDQIAGAQLFFKCENLQKTGSFKFRGATNAVFSLTETEAARGIVTQSSGNHAAAISLAARRRGIPAWIVMPRTAPRAKRQAVESYGGRVTECEYDVASRDAACKILQEKTGAVLIHPYNNERVIAGQGTAALELLEEIPDLDIVIAPVSGGGLLSGTAIASKSLRSQIRVIGAEPRNADDAYRSLAAGKIEPAAKTATIADGLRATLCPLTLSIFRERVDEIALVTEEEILSSMKLLWERLKLIVEPSGAVSAAIALQNKIHAAGKRVGIILSGGNLDLDHIPFLKEP
ncbi:MAG TPA: pyridoxal-phosphate dependent enzyme [Candidatus Acidoferrales bacterium]|nr:pyridoxal-phosphate dependent enzyme [Candidatus Acidoferrales bacterium]